MSTRATRLAIAEPGIALSPIDVVDGLARETSVTINGSLTASGRNFGGGVFLENRSVSNL